VPKKLFKKIRGKGFLKNCFKKTVPFTAKRCGMILRNRLMYTCAKFREHLSGTKKVTRELVMKIHEIGNYDKMRETTKHTAVSHRKCSNQPKLTSFANCGWVGLEPIHLTCCQNMLLQKTFVELAHGISRWRMYSEPSQGGPHTHTSTRFSFWGHTAIRRGRAKLQTFALGLLRLGFLR